MRLETALICVCLPWSVLATGETSSAAPQRELACAGQPPPDGWVVIDRRFSPTRCGDGAPSQPNQQLLERIARRPTGSRVAVCIDALTPHGWLEVDRQWHPANRCVRRSSPSQPNVKIIKRLD